MNFSLLYAARALLYPLRQTPDLLAYALRVLEYKCWGEANLKFASAPDRDLDHLIAPL